MRKPEHLDLIHKIGPIISPESCLPGSLLDQNFVRALLTHVAKEVVSPFNLSADNIEDFKSQLEKHFGNVAPDLRTNGNLARGHSERLVDYLLRAGATSEREILVKGAVEFYKIGREVFGPLWCEYINEVLASGKGGEIYLFPARDATPLYWTAVGLLQGYSRPYRIRGSTFIHVDWNRWFMGQEDETDSGGKALSFKDPEIQRFYRQMGFGAGRMVKIVEPGAWGSSANALKTNMSEQSFELWFLFSHMPERIYGFLNERVKGVNPSDFEMINDSQEGVPKPYTRPETLIEQNGVLVADISDKMVGSPYFRVWSWAVNQGALDAGVLFARGRGVDMIEHVGWMIELSNKAKGGFWTGMLPDHTETWSKGEDWKKNWKWGKIPPLK